MPHCSQRQFNLLRGFSARGRLQPAMADNATAHRVSRSTVTTCNGIRSRPVIFSGGIVLAGACQCGVRRCTFYLSAAELLAQAAAENEGEADHTTVGVDAQAAQKLTFLQGSAVTAGALEQQHMVVLLYSDLI
jgi:hypothetical protein